MRERQFPFNLPDKLREKLNIIESADSDQIPSRVIQDTFKDPREWGLNKILSKDIDEVLTPKK